MSQNTSIVRQNYGSYLSGLLTAFSLSPIFYAFALSTSATNSRGAQGAGRAAAIMQGRSLDATVLKDRTAHIELSTSPSLR